MNIPGMGMTLGLYFGSEKTSKFKEEVYCLTPPQQGRKDHNCKHCESIQDFGGVALFWIKHVHL